jgi:hypothetical protein
MSSFSPTKNEIGNRYGRLLILYEDGRDKYKNTKWFCVCDCGNTKSILGMNLRKKMTTSCGCVQKEKSGKVLHDMNFKHGKSRTKQYKTYYSRKHFLAKRKQMPLWANETKIKDIYLKRPIGYHVDHIIPLQGKLVCGLHVENNLQYLPAKENMAKHNFFEVI